MLERRRRRRRGRGRSSRKVGRSSRRFKDGDKVKHQPSFSLTDHSLQGTNSDFTLDRSSPHLRLAVCLLTDMTHMNEYLLHMMLSQTLSSSWMLTGDVRSGSFPGAPNSPLACEQYRRVGCVVSQVCQAVNLSD